MNDVETHQKFISLRAQGISFQRIAEELKVSKPTLISWSRKFQSEAAAQNLRSPPSPSPRPSPPGRGSTQVVLGLLQMRRAFPTHRSTKNRLRFSLSPRERAGVRGKSASVVQHASESNPPIFPLTSSCDWSNGSSAIQREIDPMNFTTPVPLIPKDEYQDEVQDWTP